jgi:D-alanyl-D-alanine carboxypeptidase
VAGPLEAMLSAMRADIKAGKAVGNKGVGKASGIHIMSAYRSPETDRDLWDKYFQGYLAKTTKEREATGDPYGAEAVKVMVRFIASRKAPPGGSNHSNGIAVHLTPYVGSVSIVTSYDNQTAWKNTWHYIWLNTNAARFGFKNYPKEAWHWGYKG